MMKCCYARSFQDVWKGGHEEEEEEEGGKIRRREEEEQQKGSEVRLNKRYKRNLTLSVR